MKLSEILRKMQEAGSSSDYEVAHGDADELLLDTLHVLAKGLKDASMVGKIIAAWKRVGKWYA